MIPGLDALPLWAQTLATGVFSVGVGIIMIYGYLKKQAKPSEPTKPSGEGSETEKLTKAIGGLDRSVKRLTKVLEDDR